MATLLIACAILSIGLLFLVKGADWLVKGGAGLAVKWGVSSGIVGFTIIAFGTSLPEFFVTTNAVLIGKDDIGLGNVVGSNIFNIAFILALCILVKPGPLLASETRHILWKELALTLIATGLYIALALRGVLDVYSSVVFLGGFTVILIYISKRGIAPPEEGLQSHGNLDYGFTILGLAGVVGGSSLFLSGAVDLATIFHIPPYIIGLSVVAAGTSIPELVTSLVAILRGYGGVSAGNILGSNYFNLLFILGVGGIIHPIAVPEQITTLILLAVTFCLVPMFTLKKPWMLRVWAFLVFSGYILYVFLMYA
ncbi:MAG: calcium/sodium antiporter [Methanolinea sp.]|jgi:cation:H+ antiporter|nr:calcium/sodium antiporter [Methanolinea sp.]